MKPMLILGALAGLSVLASGCAQSRLRIQDDFGQAVNEDLVAQIADPDAGRNAGPPPPSDGARAALAVSRYRRDAIIAPTKLGASGSAPGYSEGSSGGGDTSAAAPAAGTTAP